MIRLCGRRPYKRSSVGGTQRRIDCVVVAENDLANHSAKRKCLRRKRERERARGEPRREKLFHSRSVPPTVLDGWRSACFSQLGIVLRYMGHRE